MRTMDYSNVDITNDINVLNHPCIEFYFLTDPSREELELNLLENKYACIIPCTLYSLKLVRDEKYVLHNFNIVQSLQSLNSNFFGSDYLISMVLGDKAAYLKSSKLSPPLCILTRYMYENRKDISWPSKFYPITVAPLYSSASVATKRYKASTPHEAHSIVSSLFNHDVDINEVLIINDISNDCDFIEVNIIIIGNPPFSIELIYSHSSTNKNNEYSKLVAKSYELFNQYSIKDFAQFKYLHNNRTKDIFYLIDINIIPFISNLVISPFTQNYGTGLGDLLSVFVLVCLNRTENEFSLDVINDILEILPSELASKLTTLKIKIKKNKEYSYIDVCKELKKRIMRTDESNKYDIVKLLNRMLESAPVLEHPDSPFIGDPSDKYSFLEDYKNIPLHPQEMEKILQISTKIFNGQMRWHATSVLYNIDPPVMFNAVVASAITNLYNPAPMTHNTSAGFLKMEKQIVNQLSELIGWDTDKSAGVFTPGGKFCITYGIKSGLNRCMTKANSNKKPIVITSENNHFSVESSCFQLGLPKSSCIRVPVDSKGTMDFQIFERILIENINNSIPIACIIFSGGNTTHCSVEDVRKGKDIVDKIFIDLPYKPYVYYDLVVCWPWLFYKYYDFDTNPLDIGMEALRRITIVFNIIKGVSSADGTGIDFHKCGFAPFTNSIFLSKNSSELYSMSGNLIRGATRAPYHYTFSNSRGATDIISAWNILQSVGIQGFQSYVANLVTVADVFMRNLPRYGFFIVEKEHTYGFATMLWACSPLRQCNFNDFIISEKSNIETNNKYLFDMFEYLKNNKTNCYYIRFLPNYIKQKNIAVLAVFPTTLNIDEANAINIAHDIGRIKSHFDEKYSLGLYSSQDVMPDEVPK